MQDLALDEHKDYLIDIVCDKLKIENIEIKRGNNPTISLNN